MADMNQEPPKGGFLMFRGFAPKCRIRVGDAAIRRKPA